MSGLWPKLPLDSLISSVMTAGRQSGHHLYGICLNTPLSELGFPGARLSRQDYFKAIKPADTMLRKLPNVLIEQPTKAQVLNVGLLAAAQLWITTFQTGLPYPDSLAQNVSGHLGLTLESPSVIRHAGNLIKDHTMTKHPTHNEQMWNVALLFKSEEVLHQRIKQDPDLVGLMKE